MTTVSLVLFDSYFEREEAPATELRISMSSRTAGPKEGRGAGAPARGRGDVGDRGAGAPPAVYAARVALRRQMGRSNAASVFRGQGLEFRTKGFTFDTTDDSHVLVCAPGILSKLLYALTPTFPLALILYSLIGVVACGASAFSIVCVLLAFGLFRLGSQQQHEEHEDGFEEDGDSSGIHKDQGEDIERFSGRKDPYSFDASRRLSAADRETLPPSPLTMGLPTLSFNEVAGAAGGLLSDDVQTDGEGEARPSSPFGSVAEVLEDEQGNGELGIDEEEEGPRKRCSSSGDEWWEPWDDRGGDEEQDLETLTALGDLEKRAASLLARRSHAVETDCDALS